MPTESQSPYLPFGENNNADWYGKDILSVKKFNRAELESTFVLAHELGRCFYQASSTGPGRGNRTSDSLLDVRF